MSLGSFALWASVVLYGVVAFDYARDRNWPLMIVFLCYAIANIGFIWQMLRGEK